MNKPAGLREAHCHLAALGEALGIESLEMCASLAECLARVEQRARSAQRERSSPPWIRLHSARPSAWPEGRWPTRAELDRATTIGGAPVPSIPCVIRSFDHHAAVANSAAMKMAGVDAASVGIVETDADGEPTGVLLEQAASAAWHAAPEPSLEERTEHVARAASHLASFGFVEVHDMLSQPWLGPALNHLERLGRLPIRVLLYSPLETVQEVHRDKKTWESDRIRLAGAKLFADGTLNSGTAFVLEPYRRVESPGAPNPHPRGLPLLSREEIAAALATTWPMGLQLAVHAIGDAAVRTVLDGFESAELKGDLTPESPWLRPLRIEHAELIDADDVPRFARLGVVASVQPCHLLPDMEVLERTLPHRLHRVLPLRELLETNCRPGRELVFGSDCPIVGPDPADSIQAATQRRRSDRPIADAIAIQQAITEEQAWAAFRD